MISVCIPVYNFDVRDLVKELYKQLTEISPASEIIIADDASDIFFYEINKETENISFVNYFRFKENKGRSKTRNFLAQKANFETIIFLDCDTRCIDNTFIKKYLEVSDKDFVFGGIAYKGLYPENKNHSLRFIYGKKREELSAETRKKFGNRLFMTGNFMIKKKLFENYKFNEKIIGYGHEDTFFAYELEKSEIKAEHINNPVFHVGLETNSIFLEKTKKSIKNLHFISKLDISESFLNRIRLWKFYKKYRFFKPVFKLFYKISKTVLIKNLMSKKPSLIVFDIYKLLLMFVLSNKK